MPFGTGEDAPDDEDISWETQQKDDAQDERAHGRAPRVVQIGVVDDFESGVNVGHCSPLKLKEATN